MNQLSGSLEAQASVDDRIQELKARIDKARTEKARAEATLEQLEAQRRDVLAKLEELGVKEEELDAEIGRLRNEVVENLREAERLLSGEG